MREHLEAAAPASRREDVLTAELEVVKLVAEATAASDRRAAGDQPEDRRAAAQELSRRRPQIKLLMLSMHDVDRYFFEALKAGASGYVLKTVADRDLVEACRSVLRGTPFLYPPVVRALMREHLEGAANGEPREDVLTPRELEVVKLVAEAHSTEQIAELLVISPKTVERHRENILAKLGMRDRVELTRYAIRRGLVEP